MDDDYKQLLEQANNLTVRRQNVTAVYLSVNTALTGAMAFLFKDGQVSGLLSQISVLTLLFSGVIACSFWRRLITQYSTLIDWWYAQLRLLEEAFPEQKRVITREFQELYQRPTNKKGLIGLTRYETRLTWLFTCIYSVFGIAILVLVLIHLL